jgi:hypothetical protein
MTIDDAQLRLLLDRLEDPPEPPSTVNLAQALAAGRRKLRRRRIARVGTSVLAIFTAAAIAVPAIGWLHHPTRPSVGPVTGQAPRSFNPLVPYAFFGRLPGGAREVAVTTSGIGVVRQVAEQPRASLSLVVLSARACHLAGPLRYRYRTRPGGPLETGLAPQSIRCPSRLPFVGIPRTALIAGAPRIGQANAYWINNFSVSGTGQDALAWQYAARGWAFVTTAVSGSAGVQTYYLSPSMKTRLHLLAKDVRFGGTAPLRFPFRLTRVPAGWGVYKASIQDLQAGQLTKLALGPADATSADLMVTWYRSRFRLNSRQSCGSSSPGERPVHLAGGVIGYLKMASWAPPRGPEVQRLCVPNVRGNATLFIDRPISPRSAAGATTKQSAPTASRFRSVIAVFKDLRFPPGGTTHPLG